MTRALAQRTVVALVATLLVAAPRVAAACTACIGNSEDANRLAFILTTAFLTVLPLLLVGGVLWWLWRRTRAAEAKDGDRPATAPSPVGPLR